MYTCPNIFTLSNTLPRNSFSMRSTTKRNNPHMRKFQSAPCHSPVNIQTVNMASIILSLPFLFPPIGIYTYSPNHLPSVICQRLQKSVKECAIYGSLKFSGILKPRIRPIPIAITEYPIKSKSSWNEYPQEPSHAVSVFIPNGPTVRTSFHRLAILFARSTLYASPSTNRVAPRSMSSAFVSR